MQITKQQSGDVLEVKITGRLDAYWSDHLNAAMVAEIREGADKIRLDLSELNYISSAGIRVLLRLYQQLNTLHGALSITNPTATVQSVLELSGLMQLLGAKEASQAVAAAVQVQTFTSERATFEVFPLSTQAAMKCQIIGTPEKLATANFTEADCHTLSLPENSFSIGLGALGAGFNDCRTRFGEYVSVSGCAAYLPTDGTNVADFLVSSGTFVPQIHALYALFCEGAFSHQLRFDTRGLPATLTEIADACLQIVNAETAGIVIVAETAGLVGAALTRSPGSAKGDMFQFPGVREWISFTTERAHAKALTLIAGVLSKNPGPLASLLRPLNKSSEISGHFHAAVHPYHPLKKGELDLKKTVHNLFESEAILGVLHLLNDDREIDGAGESEFIRGTCWVGAIHSIRQDGNSS